MKNGSKNIQVQIRQQRFYNELPEEFNWMKAVDIGTKCNMSPSSVRRYLLGGQFERTAKGLYRKVVKVEPGEH
jgi:hypothetical protein